MFASQKFVIDEQVAFIDFNFNRSYKIRTRGFDLKIVLKIEKHFTKIEVAIFLQLMSFGDGWNSLIYTYLLARQFLDTLMEVFSFDKPILS